ncbi:MAG: glycine zipper family protein [Prevotella sp.]|nr:glycine zipper family protein [Prevotella sp.]
MMIYAVGAALLLSSCNTYEGQGAYAGVQLGGIFGSAIGGLNGGPRGSAMGAIVGMTGGAIVGAAIGAAQDQKEKREVHERYERVRQAREQRQPVETNDVYSYGQEDNGSGFDVNNGGDDRLYDFQMEGGESSAEVNPEQQSPVLHIGEDAHAGRVEIRNVRFKDNDGDNTIARNELCEVSFEVYNNSKSTIFNVQPALTELTNNKHIIISPSIRVEQIAPGKGVRYTAMIKADNRLQDGQITLLASVSKGNQSMDMVEFTVSTMKKRQDVK